ncbi:MAG TPA: amidohydrolase family protein, partial [Clostridia bacterium]|nr:amidohydrolase family protein [Clostridia bacterium]
SFDASISMSSNPEFQPAGVANPKLKPVDMHVHVVGNGSGGTGCWVRISAWRRPMAALMLRQIGLPMSALTGDLDRLYAERLLELIRESSLGHAVILAQEMVHDDQGRPLKEAGTLYVPNDYVLKLGRQHPEFLPAISIHPGRPDALEELERCLDGGAVMMKCLPNCQNINCSDRRYTRFWERMAEAKLPLLAHTGGEHTLPIVRPEFSDPRLLTLPLECGVTVIAAHCATKSGLTDPEYFHFFAGMTERFPNLYGDISAFTVPIRGRHVPKCVREPLVQRMIHGSDFPVPVYGHFPWLRGFVDWKSFRRWENHPNVLEKDYQLKVAMGFPPEVFTRIWGLLRIKKPQTSSL